MAPFAIVRIFAFIASAGMLSQPAFSQGGTPAPTAPPTTTPTAPGGGATTPGNTRPPSNIPGTQTPTTQMPGQRQDQFPDMNRPIFLSGRVRLDDGTAPGETVVIERVCNGIARPEAYTDSKGHFSFERGRNQGMFADASVSGPGMGGMGGNSGIGQQAGGFGSNSMGGRGISERDLMGCELRAALPGYRSEIVNLAARRAFDNPDVGTILMHRLGNVEGRIISATTLNAPKDAKKAFEKGQDLVKRKKFDEAVKSFQKAVEVYPKHAAAWYELGRLQEKDNHAEDAAKSYEQATAADPRYIMPYLQLAYLAARKSNWKDTADYSAKVIKLDPFAYPQAFFYNSVANYNLKNYEAAEKSAREAQKLDPKHSNPRVDHLLGLVLAERHDFTGAAEQMRNYLKFAPGAQDAAAVRNQLSELEKMASGTAPRAPEPQPQ
jgi:tetratricopeptide (TPR) repeat protein